MPVSLPAHPRRQRHRRGKGQALVEFALVLPIMFLLLATALDLGRVAYAQITVTNAAREGAMQASRTPAAWIVGTACDPANPDVNLVMCRTQLESKDSWVTIEPSDVQMSCSPSCLAGLGNMASVSVTGHMRLVTPLIAAFFGGNMDISFAATSSAQIETLPSPVLPWPSQSPSASPSSSPSSSPSASPTQPHCPTPSAGFTYTVTYSGNDQSKQKKPATVAVVDTSTPTSLEYPGCEVNYWFWEWGDGTTASGRTPGAHTYYAQGTYIVKLTVNSPYSVPNTTGGATIVVKP